MFWIFVALILANCLQIFADSTVITTVEEGLLKGIKSQTKSGFQYYEFLSIPYAQPPIGPLRFQSPQEPIPWTGVKDATKADSKKISYQIDPFKSRQILGSEDCLYLSIYTPSFQNKTTNLLPVMVYIHGGGYIFGNGIIKNDNNPELLVEQGVVVVSINYRLGIFGFLSLNLEKARGNMGLKDQIQALKWVKRNIVNFGGDKDKVTVFGISAGSASIEYLILSPNSKDLFKNAILESGSSLNHWAINLEIKELSLKVAQHLGFRGNNRNKMLNFLVNKVAVELFNATSKIINDSNKKELYFGFVPTIERYFGDNDYIITEKPYKLLKNGEFNKINILKGFCNKEGTLTYSDKKSQFETLKLHKNFVEILPYVFVNPDEVNSWFIIAYTNTTGNVTNDVAMDFYSDFDFISGIWISNDLMARQNVQTYIYEFSYDGSLNFLKKMFDLKIPGAAHADEAGYILNQFPEQQTTALDDIVRKRMIKMWTDFAKTGNPTPQMSEYIPVLWPQYSTYSKSYISIGNELKIEHNFQSKRMSLFTQLYDKFYH